MYTFALIPISIASLYINLYYGYIYNLKSSLKSIDIIDIFKAVVFLL